MARSGAQKKLRVILGDQLNTEISSLIDINAAQDLCVMGEVWDETNYVKHHKKKIAFIFSAMRHFAQELQDKNYDVYYHKLDKNARIASFTELIAEALKQGDFDEIIITEPGEYRVLKQIEQWESLFGIPVDIRPDNRFLCTHDAFKKWAQNRQELRMEFFYREMRRKYNILIEDGEPVGDKWNLDAENRKPPQHKMNIPAPYHGHQDSITKAVMTSVQENFNDHFGDLNPFYFAVTRDQALYALDKFIEERLPDFGTYQDAMISEEPWMYHSHLSFYLNCGLLLPLEVIHKAEKAYYQNQAPLNAVEGFIRQILGWREFIRGVYWLKMPGYENENKLNAHRDLPWFYWSGETDMNCLRQCISETRKNAYAHHIQRLMVLGNFALLCGFKPSDVNEWYMIVYADAYQWVELPNVTGMILYADGGLFASKPYAASGSYINRMSDYCKNCAYSVSQKTGQGACPFNYLYWDFMMRNRDALQDNPRLGRSYYTLDKMDADKKKTIRKNAKDFLQSLK